MNITQDTLDGGNEDDRLYTVAYAGLRIYVVARTWMEAHEKFLAKRWVGISPMSTVNPDLVGIAERV